MTRKWCSWCRWKTQTLVEGCANQAREAVVRGLGVRDDGVGTFPGDGGDEGVWFGGEIV